MSSGVSASPSSLEKRPPSPQLRGEDSGFGFEGGAGAGAGAGATALEVEVLETGTLF